MKIKFNKTPNKITKNRMSHKTVGAFKYIMHCLCWIQYMYFIIK